MQKNMFDKMQKIFNRVGKRRIIIWGASVRGKCFLKWIDRFGQLDNVLFFVDNDSCIQGKKIDKFDIFSPEKILPINDAVVMIASGCFDSIEKEINQLSTSIEYYNVCEFCVPSKLEELFSVYGDNQRYAIFGHKDNYSREIEYLKLFGLDVADSYKPNDGFFSRKNDFVFIIVDLDHLSLEKELIESGLNYNRNYVVITEIFHSEYFYTKNGNNIVEFDRGTLGDKGLKDYFCPLPFTQLYYYDYRADICSPTWNNDINVGNPQIEDIERIWNSERSQEIRASILDGSFKYCNEEICWRLLEGRLFRKDQITNQRWREIIDKRETKIEGGPEFLNVGYNAMCNLRCRMCRDGTVFIDPKVRETALGHIKKYNFENLKRLVIPGNGELFANKDYLDFLVNIDECSFPVLEAIWIYSNGVLFTEENWNKISFLAKRYKVKIFISTDSACRETFLKVRRGGDYGKFITNLKMLAEKKKQNEFNRLYLPFCVQRENFREMVEFVYFAKEIGADCVHFEKLFNSKICDCVHRPENVYFELFTRNLEESVKVGKRIGIDVEVKPFTKLLRGENL